ncbi:hypothetical protein A0256_08675 [Mucilaginibacter sp. PAMC 26640]|nr:hypothetical protein A0256_08675 [Mucilaginibacter sp. PAMC 26640]
MAFNRSFVPQDDNGGYCKQRAWRSTDPSFLRMTMVEQTLPSFTVLKVVGENTNNGESVLAILRNEGSINKLCKPMCMAFNVTLVPQDDNGGCCKPTGMAFNRSFVLRMTMMDIASPQAWRSTYPLFLRATMVYKASLLAITSLILKAILPLRALCGEHS